MNREYVPAFSEFSGRTCLISGGSGLIGAELSKYLAKLGAKVIVLDVNLKNQIPGITHYEVDFNDHVQSYETISTILENQIIDHLFNCASFKPYNLESFYKPGYKYDMEILEQAMRINLTSVTQICGLVGTQMIKREFGTIVNFASIYGSSMGADQRIYDNLNKENYFNTPVAYSISKGGVVALTKHLSAAWGKFNVRTNVISPGGVLNKHPDSFISAYSNRVPMNRMAKVQEIVLPAIFLASDSASYINGHELFVDGGLHAW